MFRFRRLLFLLPLQVASSCLTIQPVEFKKTENITTNRTPTDFEMTFDLAMYNPNNQSIRLTALETFQQKLR
jgi:hypothetical protein